MSQLPRPFTVVSVSAIAGLLVAACGARGPLDLQVVDVLVTPDGSASNTSPPATAADAGEEGGSSISDDAGGTGTGPGIPGLSEDGGLLGCGACVATSCTASIATCLQDTTCAASLQCILTTCLAGGTSGGGLSCFTSCAGTSGLTNLLPILECVAGTCGSACGSLIGGVGGL